MGQNKKNLLYTHVLSIYVGISGAAKTTEQSREVKDGHVKLETGSKTSASEEVTISVEDEVEPDVVG